VKSTHLGKKIKIFHVKNDDLTVNCDGISVLTQPFLMKMYKKRKFNKIWEFFGILRAHFGFFPAIHFPSSLAD